jgi:flagellar FliJ protein
MSGFEFRLQSLLKLRTADRDQRRAELASAFQASQVLAGQMTALQKTIQQTRRDIRQGSTTGPVNVDRLLGSHRYELLLASQLDQLKQRQQEIETEIERRRQRLLEADRQVRTVEKLRERKLAEYQADLARQEQRQLDEIGTRRAHAGRGDEPS